jgi:hypothetical protein
MPKNILDKTLAPKEEVKFLLKAGEQYSTAILRSSFYMTSVHCPGNSDMCVQVSNVTVPDLDTDADWFNIGTGEFVSCKPAPFKWLRIKFPEAVTDDTVVYLHSIKASY